jgi:ABC-type sugar transport system ATPase subunit
MSGLTVTGLTVTGLTKSFGKNLVIDNVSFEVEEGEFAILLGPSGCGKSTILRLVAGLDRQDAGDVAIGGTVVNDLPPRARDVAMVFQSYALYPHLSVPSG